MKDRQKKGMKVLLSLVIAITMIGIPANIFTSASNESNQQPPIDNPVPMDYTPSWSPETFDTDLGVFATTDFGNANDWEWNSGGYAYHAGMSPYDAVSVDDYLISPCIPTQMYGTYTLDFDYRGGGSVEVYYTWADPTKGYEDGTWYYVGTYGNSPLMWSHASDPLSTGLDNCNCFYVVFRAYDNGVGEDIDIDNVAVDFTFSGVDVDVTKLVKPDPSKFHRTQPTEVWAEVTNVGDVDATDVDLHLQIYEEIDYQPEIDWYDNMESCCVNWSAEDRDGDGLTWERTDRRYDSPTHSWRVTGCNRATYAGNSYDTLLSKPIKIPKWETKVWANFSLWVQGEINEVDNGVWKFEDYLAFYIGIEDDLGNWHWYLVDKYVDTNGKWMHPENMVDGHERLNMFGADYDHWNCSKGSGAPWKWWGGIDLQPYFDDLKTKGYIANSLPAGKTVRFNFTWKSDPCHNYEGAYIDDFRLLSQRGSLQPLVYQGYKFLHELDAGETKLVKFPLEYTFKEDQWYFIEVYSNVADDVDGPGDEQYTVKQTDKGGYLQDEVKYRDPWNGVNESIYFGDIHDGAVIKVKVPDEVELEMGQCADTACADIPIEVTVRNNGTIEEDIPVQVLARQKITVNYFSDDFENGTLDKWKWFHTMGDQTDKNLVHITDWKTHTGKYAMFFGNNRNFLEPYMEQGAVAQIGGGLPKLTGKELNIMLRYWAMWKMDAEGNSNFMDTTTSIFDYDYDAFHLIFYDPIRDYVLDNTFSGFGLTGHSNDRFYGPTQNGGLTNPYYYNENAFEINLVPMLEHYNYKNSYSGYSEYHNLTLGWVVKSDEKGEPDLTYPGEIWSGLIIDDVSIDAEYPGPIVWESEIKSIHLNPGESKTVKFTWHACNYSFYVVEGRTVLEGDCNAKNDFKFNQTYLYDQAYYDDIEHIGKPISKTACKTTYKHWETEDNTCKTPSPYVTICSNDACDWNLDHYWYFGDPQSLRYPSNADIVLQIINDSEDGSFNLTKYTNVTIEFNIWKELENQTDWFTLEISNDSGQNWFLLKQFTNVTDEHENEENWTHYNKTLWNFSATPPKLLVVYDGYDPTTGWINPHTMGITDKMHFRFHLLANVSLEFKGVYLDDIYINSSRNETIPWNGVDKNWRWETTTIFHDDMEDPSYSASHWISYDGAPTGDKWHVTTLHSPHSPTHKWWCGDEDALSSYHKHLERADLDPSLTKIVYEHSYLSYRNNSENNLTLTVDLSDKYQAFLMYWENYTFADRNDYGLLKLSKDGGQTWIEIGGTEGLTSNGWKQRKFDITFMLPAVLQIRWEFISNETGSDIGWEIDDINITAKPDCQEPTTTCIFNPPIPDGNNGWYVSPVEVTLVAKDDKKVAETYYSIDGGNWTLYTSPFSVSADGLHTITYYSIDHVGNAEDIKSCTFKIDKTAPIGSIDMPKAGYIYLLGRELMPRIFIKDKALIIGGLKATATATDDTSGMYYVTFTTSKGTIEDAIKPYEFNLPFYFPFGSDTLSVTITDFAGNSASAGSTDYLKIL